MRFLAGAVLAGMVLPGVAWAHAFLRTASPAVGSTVAAAPTEIRITFTEGVEPAFSSIALADASGRPVAVGPVHLEDGDTHLAVAVQGLAAGIYQVTWHATATDTHRTTGSFRFSVVAPAGGAVSR